MLTLSSDGTAPFQTDFFSGLIEKQQLGAAFGSRLWIEELGAGELAGSKFALGAFRRLSKPRVDLPPRISVACRIAS
jgi:hypothetical protein